MSSPNKGRHLHPASGAHPGLTTQVCGLMPHIKSPQQFQITGQYAQLPNVIYKAPDSSMQQAVHSDKLGVQTRPKWRPKRQAWHHNMTKPSQGFPDFPSSMQQAVHSDKLRVQTIWFWEAFGTAPATQILRLPQKMLRIVDCRDIWNVIYNARSNRHHPPTSPNTAPATQNECHAWCPSHMKRHLHCAEQQASHSNLTKYCACHAKCVSCMMSVTYETSFTLRKATGITLQPHQILRLPRKMSLMHDVRHIWNVIYNARSNRHLPPTSPDSAPATQNESHAWCPSHMKRHLQCAEQQASPSNLTKYCACHTKWVSFMMSITYETSFTMRGATGITLQPHQILRLPHKMSLIHDVHHIWNVIYNARSNRHHPSTSPNAAPATQNDSPKSKRNSLATVEVAITMRGRFDHDPRVSCYWTVTQLSWTCYSSELLLNCYSSELLLNCYSTELLLNCYSSELLLNCDSTELLLNCYSSELLLNWAVIAFLKLRNSEVSHLNFLWQWTKLENPPICMALMPYSKRRSSDGRVAMSNCRRVGFGSFFPVALPSSCPWLMSLPGCGVQVYMC